MLPAVFAVIVASIAFATLFTQWQLSAIRARSSEIADRVAPNIARLGKARGEMRQVQLVLHEYGDAQSTRANVEAVRHELDGALAAYPSLPSQISSAKVALDDAIERELASPSPEQTTDVSATADRLSTAITHEIEADASRSHLLAIEIERVYAHAKLVAYALAVAVAAITALGASALRRTMRVHADLVARHRELLEARASELEEFAGRAAHDILSPLSVVGMSLKLAAISADDDRVAILNRGSNAIHRIDQLIDGLLSFAVAGAQPEEGAHADVAATIADVASELRATACDAGCDLDVDIDVASPIACHAGVLTSIVSNLVRNAIKYTAGCATRRIDVRAREVRGAIRIDVSDTGPGLPDEIASRVFEPYVRGKNSTLKKSIGLGLATVKRLVTAHGGTVSVDSRRGEGCTFYVELPKGEAHRAHAALDEAIA
jgi:signal transduction histidine kinase